MASLNNFGPVTLSFQGKNDNHKVKCAPVLVTLLFLRNASRQHSPFCALFPCISGRAYLPILWLKATIIKRCARNCFGDSFSEEYRRENFKLRMHIHSCYQIQNATSLKKKMKCVLSFLSSVIVVSSIRENVLKRI